MSIVAQMDIMSNYYYIRKVPTGREGYLAQLQNCENVQNGSKTIAKLKNLGSKFCLGRDISQWILVLCFWDLCQMIPTVILHQELTTCRKFRSCIPLLMSGLTCLSQEGSVVMSCHHIVISRSLYSISNFTVPIV